MDLIFHLTKSTKVWVRGLIAAFISGGAGSAATGLAVNLMDPKDFNLGAASFLPMLKLLVVSLILHGGIGVMMFLSKSPLPDQEG